MIKFNKEFFKGSVILLIAFNIYNTINFFFQFSMAHLLSVIEYGILATLYSFIYSLGIFSDSIQTVITKYSSTEQDKGRLKNIIKKSLNKALKISLVLFIIYGIASIFISPILKIEYYLFLLNGITIFAFFLPPVNRGIMQGKKRFYSLGYNMIIEAVIKLSFAVLLVLLGWKVYGAMTATVLGFAIAFLFSFFSLKDIFQSKEKPSKTEGIYQYTAPVFIILFSLTFFFSIDVIIAKMMFPESIAGSYAIASTLAKIVFIGTQPISRAMFSISSENSEKEQKSSGLLINALSILFVCITLALLIYYFFPDFIIKIFSGKSLPGASAILFYLAIAFSLLSITNLLILYKLSLGKTKTYLIFLIFPLIEVILCFIFSANLVQFSIALIVASAIFLWGSILLLDR